MSASASHAQRKVVVCGGGIVGLTTAYQLRKRGLQVVLLERRRACSLETSYANACLLAPDYTLPRTAGLRDLIRWSFSHRHSTHIAANAWLDPHFWRWGIQHLRTGLWREARKREVATAMTSLATYGMNSLDAVVEDCPAHLPSYSTVDKGLLQVYRSETAMREFADTARKLLSHVGCEFTVLSAAECLEMEPWLRHTHFSHASNEPTNTHALAGGLYFPNNRTADVYAFSEGLQGRCEEIGVEFVFGASVARLAEEDKGKWCVEMCDGRVVKGDDVVMACGAFSDQLLSQIGVNCPIYPVSGHSITVDTSPSNRNDNDSEEGDSNNNKTSNSDPLTMSVCDGDTFVYYSPLSQGRVRVAAFGDFAGFAQGPRHLDPSRFGQLLTHARTFGGLLSPAGVSRALTRTRTGSVTQEECRDEVCGWRGLRPLTPDSLPYVGRVTSMANLWVNTGHGGIGWKAANGSARLLADLLVGDRKTDIDPNLYDPDRFA